MNSPATDQPRVVFENLHPSLGDGTASILNGLRSTPKTLNPMWFYDQRGSELFDAITRLPEYYPTRTERRILVSRADEIADACPSCCLLLEPGSGSSEKVRLLLNAINPEMYVPVDISAEFLKDAAFALGDEFPQLRIHAVCADFAAGWEFLDKLPDHPRVAFYPGSTIGNLEPARAEDFLRGLRDVVGPAGGIIIGVDTHKDAGRLNAAYNDSAGITAQFNLNVLRRINAMLGADFDASRFEHRAFYNEDLRRIEMHLVSRGEQVVPCVGESIAFSDGESIHTENSYKYTLEDFTDLAESADLHVAQSWFDDERLFGVHYLAVD
ncbi:MAG: L-histidine N(alpha)-methyltransferase [Pseudomonadota bacterium]